jgi:hypothetical protein
MREKEMNTTTTLTNEDRDALARAYAGDWVQHETYRTDAAADYRVMLAREQSSAALRAQGISPGARKEFREYIEWHDACRSPR